MRNKTFGRAVGGIAVVAAMFALAACSSDPAPATDSTGTGTDSAWNNIEQQADSQGLVRVYTTLVPAVNDSLTAAFNEKYPDISLEFTRGTATELSARLDAEISSGSDGADVIIDLNPQWFEDNKANFTGLDALPAAATWPSDGWMEDQLIPKVVISTQAMITWNTNIFPNGFADWSDVLKTDVDGKLGIYENPNLNTATYYDWLERLNGPDYLPQLAKNSPKFYPSVVPMTQAIASGEIGVSLFNVPSVVKDLQKAGAPIDYVVPSETEGGFFTSAVLKNAKRPDAALVLTDFMLTPEGQEAMNGDGYAASVLPNIPGTIQPTNVFLLGDEPQTDLAAVNAHFAEVFGR